jgi:hypothetical protein
LPLPYGFSAWKAEDILGGYDRPAWLVENEDEVLLAYNEHKEPRLTCFYCANQSPRTRDARRAIHWFHSHDCGLLEQAEAAGIVLDVTPLAEAA